MYTTTLIDQAFVIRTARFFLTLDETAVSDAATELVSVTANIGAVERTSIAAAIRTELAAAGRSASNWDEWANVAYVLETAR
jgi:hypothetical protein